MPKQKKNLSLKDYLDKYESKSLQAALNGLEDSLAWDILKSFIKLKQREFEVAALDLSCQDGNTLRAAKASGIACGLEEVADKYIDEFKKIVSGYSAVVENPRPEEE